ncbi:hypothetical protein [Microseira wollei]|uniref:Uncharacterized protein n=1 Tax=Microseira wollei NIES-4236 TaxID=2530354 RepID=A0AAV3XEF2_9CYAN|nr:hypothetical protein [Microseira wollei]GET40928.1 hypothetical protein MiSe_57400 [Microseira wollei NIES-4236]
MTQRIPSLQSVLAFDRSPIPALISIPKMIYSGFQSDEVHLGLCSGSINAAATQKARKRCTSQGLQAAVSIGMYKDNNETYRLTISC